MIFCNLLHSKSYLSINEHVLSVPWPMKSSDNLL